MNMHFQIEFQLNNNNNLHIFVGSQIQRAKNLEFTKQKQQQQQSRRWKTKMGIFQQVFLWKQFYLNRLFWIFYVGVFVFSWRWIHKWCCKIQIWVFFQTHHTKKYCNFFHIFQRRRRRQFYFISIFLWIDDRLHENKKCIANQFCTVHLNGSMKESIEYRVILDFIYFANEKKTHSTTVDSINISYTIVCLFSFCNPNPLLLLLVLLLLFIVPFHNSVVKKLLCKKRNDTNKNVTKITGWKRKHTYTHTSARTYKSVNAGKMLVALSK